MFFMKFNSIFFNKAPLHLAVEKNDIELVKLLLNCENININIQTVCIFNFCYKIVKYLFF